jgi:hypothetical protein
MLEVSDLPRRIYKVEGDWPVLDSALMKSGLAAAEPTALFDHSYLPNGHPAACQLAVNVSMLQPPKCRHVVVVFAQAVIGKPR